MEKIKNQDFNFIDFDNMADLISASRLGNTLIKKEGWDKNDAIELVVKLLINPSSYLDTKYNETAQALIDNGYEFKEKFKNYDLLDEHPSYEVYGATGIDLLTHDQMKVAMSLPISISGALMPDAHVGYGLPVGGVLATEPDKIIPYAVGVDIACRMAISIFDVNINKLNEDRDKLASILDANTFFGMGSMSDKIQDHAILDSNKWKEYKFIRGMKDIAAKQLGSSGGGNHFVEFGIVEIEEDNVEGYEAGEYLALLSHSGSRGFGARIANHYSNLAQERVKLLEEAKHLAWLDINDEVGHEYWTLMNMAGEYASACHRIIHDRITKTLGAEVLYNIENHHNFAWQEKLSDGRDVMVHRKGATPASKGTLGIIPGSMTQPGFIVSGKGEEESINSASHGAGREMSRKVAFSNITRDQMNRELKKHDVHLIGGDLDEAPMAYKDINKVMGSQKDLVDIIGVFQPKIVKMAAPDRAPWIKEL